MSHGKRITLQLLIMLATITMVLAEEDAESTDLMDVVEMMLEIIYLLKFGGEIIQRSAQVGFVTSLLYLCVFIIALSITYEFVGPFIGGILIECGKKKYQPIRIGGWMAIISGIDFNPFQHGN